MKKLLFVMLCLPGIINAEIIDGQKYPDARCNESRPARFKNCICSTDTPRGIIYRPKLRECGGDAGAILSGKLRNAYSIVLRDSENRDRWPTAGSGYGDCSFELANSEAPPNRCSAFKVQSKIRTSSSSVLKNRLQTIHCFGEAASHPHMKNATRLTLKLRDVPGSTADPLLRVCLKNFNQNNNLN
jgi:hypothetical protein